MFNEDGWHIALRDYFMRRALKREQAEECVTQVFLRYHTKADAPPWGVGTPPPLFWRLARDVLCEHFRRQTQVKQRLEKLQFALTCDAETCVETLAIDELDAERFVNSLPDRLRRVLELRLQGYTCAEVAEQMSLSPGTVKAYLAELRKKFVKYYGYDPTETPCCDGNIYGSFSGAEASASYEEEERQNALEEVSGLDGGRSVRGKRVRPSPHTCRARRARGGAQPPEDLGCSDVVAVATQTEKRQVRGGSLLLPMIASCACDIQSSRDETQYWCPPKWFFEPACEAVRQDRDGDGWAGEPNYLQSRQRHIYYCATGAVYVVCDGWTYASLCCGISGTAPGCLDGLSGNPLKQCSSVGDL